MTNHVHLLLTPEKQESAALLMKHLGQRYVQYINRTYRRSGTLWEGRFRFCLAHDEEYVLGCYRYIELNPVRTAMVAHPADYKWSSYRTNGEGQIDALLTPHKDYLRLGASDETRRKCYRALFKAHLDPELLTELRTATNGNYVLGSERFKEEGDPDVETARGAGAIWQAGSQRKVGNRDLSREPVEIRMEKSTMFCNASLQRLCTVQ